MTEKRNLGHDHKLRSALASVIVVLLCAVPLVATIAYGAVDSWTIGLIALLTAVIVVLWLVDGWRSGEFRFSSNKLQLPILGLIVLGCIQLLPFASNSATELLAVPVSPAVSMDPYATRFFLIRLLTLFAFLAMSLVYISGGSRSKRIAVALTIFGALAAFFGIIQRLSIPDSIYGLRATPQAIPFGPFVNQHHFAALMVMTSGLTLGMLFGRSFTRERKLFLAIAAGIMGMAVVFTGSRGGMMSYLGVVVFAALASFARGSNREEIEVSESRNRNLLVLASALGLVILVLGSVSYLGGGMELLRGLGVEQSPTDPTSGRMHFWSVAWKIFLEHPVFGSGFDSFGVAFTKFDTWNGTFRVEQVHNDYLQMLSDGGIAGFACIAVFVVLLLKNGVLAIGNRASETHRGIVVGALAGCFGILIHSFFDFPLRTNANAFVFLLLVAIAAGSVERKGHNHNHH
jgi:O-antigen ligase